MKERRPSISPNFNFLGQLVEFDTQLTKLRSAEGTSSSSLSATQTSQSSGVTQMKMEVPERAPSPSKRPCMINLSRAVQSRRSPSRCSGGLVVQSPTTALSRLQFVEQRQTMTTAAVNVPTKSTAADDFTTESPETSQSKTTTAVENQIADTKASTFQTSRPASSSSRGVQHHEQQKLPSSSSWSRQTPAGDAERTSAVSSSNMTADVLLVDWQNSLKSRSLEDILLVSTSPPRSLGHVTSHWMPAEETGEGHGSLSTGHASLHGSLEMIQVS